MKRKMGFITTAVIAIWGFLMLVLSPAACAQAVDGVAENTKPSLQMTHQAGTKVVVQGNCPDSIPNGVGNCGLGRPGEISLPAMTP